MLSKESEKDTIWFHSYVKFKKQMNKGGEIRGKPRNRLLTIENKLMVIFTSLISKK